MLALAQIWDILEAIPDPEIPVVSLVEMGIVRDVSRLANGSVVVVITPTFSGCPALQVMQDNIAAALAAAGEESVEIRISHAPAWSTEWISSPARGKLRAFGITPPPRFDKNFELVLHQMVDCPYCGSENTEIRNSFGPTPCRSLSFCFDCQQPFEHFKPL